MTDHSLLVLFAAAGLMAAAAFGGVCAWALFRWAKCNEFYSNHMVTAARLNAELRMGIEEAKKKMVFVTKEGKLVEPTPEERVARAEAEEVDMPPTVPHSIVRQTGRIDDYHEIIRQQRQKMGDNPPKRDNYPGSMTAEVDG